MPKMDFLENIPDWVRWLVFLPVAFIALFLAYPIIKIGYLILSHGEFEVLLGQLFIIIMAGLCSGYVFVWIGAKVAPKSQFVVSLVLTVIVSLLGGMAIMSKIILGAAGNMSWIELIVSISATLVGAIGACISFYEEPKNKKQEIW